jgi:hypothetical protein
VTAPRPPLPWLIAYRVLGLRLPPEHRAWIAEDVAQKTFTGWRSGRTVLWGATFTGLYALAQTAVYEAPAQRTMVRIGLLLLASSLLASRTTLVKRTLRWQRVDKRGRPVEPHKLAVLENGQALVLGLAVLVAFTGAMGVFGFAQRPTGFTVAKCEPLGSELTARVQAAFVKQGSTLQRAQAVAYQKRRVVLAQVVAPGETQGLPLLLVIDDGRAMEVLQGTDKAKQHPLTTFPPAPDKISTDVRGLTPAVLRLSQCLSRVAPTK